jgi:hypothetical protein
MTQITPIRTWNVGSGAGTVQMGLYAFSVRSDDAENILSRGYTICPTRMAADELNGLYEPDVNKRIGFSQTRGSEVAVAGSAEPQHPLNEAQRENARRFIELAQDNFADASKALACRDDIRLMRINPAAILEENEWDRNHSTALHAVYDISDNIAIISGLNTAMQYMGSRAAKAFNEPHSELPPKKPPQSQPPARKPAALALTEQPAVRAAEILGELGKLLNKHFAGSENEAGRNAVFDGMKAVVIPKTGPQK